MIRNKKTAAIVLALVLIAAPFFARPQFASAVSFAFPAELASFLDSLPFLDDNWRERFFGSDYERKATVPEPPPLPDFPPQVVPSKKDDGKQQVYGSKVQVDGTKDKKQVEKKEIPPVSVTGKKPKVETNVEPEQESAPLPPTTPPLLPEAATSSPEQVEKRGVFDGGAVTFRFDDSWDAHHSVAAPLLEQNGMRGTFYISTEQTEENGFRGFLSVPDIKDLYARGHEIGAHTETHPHLKQLNASAREAEIMGSRDFLRTLGVGPVSSFAYPFGEYDQHIIELVKEAGFESAAATVNGYARPTSDPYQLPRQSVELPVTPETVKTWIDTAKRNHEWLILTFHRIDSSGETYSTPVADFEEIVTLVKQSNLPVVTISEGIASLDR